jgi:hypothetical protein
VPPARADEENTQQGELNLSRDLSDPDGEQGDLLLNQEASHSEAPDDTVLNHGGASVEITVPRAELVFVRTRRVAEYEHANLEAGIRRSSLLNSPPDRFEGRQPGFWLANSSNVSEPDRSRFGRPIHQRTRRTPLPRRMPATVRLIPGHPATPFPHYTGSQPRVFRSHAYSPNFEGNICGSLNGLLMGNMTGCIDGDLCPTSRIRGTMRGDIIGSLFGTILGDMFGSVHGVMGGWIAGDFVGTLHGDFTGVIDGNFTGIAKGRFEGTVHGTTRVLRMPSTN